MSQASEFELFGFCQEMPRQEKLFQFLLLIRLIAAVALLPWTFQDLQKGSSR
jgi:hypothetical protein